MKKVIRLKSEFEKLVRNAEEILVATAMMSDYGLSQFNERNEDCLFQVLVGIDLPTQPSALQRMYNDEIEVRVHNVKGQFFHPKVYLFNKGEKWTAFVGSGNCTMGGIERNIEMSIKVEDESTIKELIHWFGIYYDKHSQELTQDFIDDYTVMFNSRKELENDLTSKIKCFKNETGVSKGKRKLTDYNFNGQFFKFEHYNAFTGIKPITDSPETRKERLLVQEKLLELHEELYPLMQNQGWKVYEHHMSQHITSSYMHNERASKELTALWLHYGRSEQELEDYQKAYGDDMTSLFHMRLEVLITKNHLWVELRVGKKDGSYPDRHFIREQLNTNPKFLNKYYKLVKALDREYTITIADEYANVKDFEDEDDLKQFTLQDNPKRYYFRIGREYQPDDKAISEQKILSTIMADFEQLYPLYQLLKHNL
tara:strand:- start:4175 stop:5452 length:1278 start_codon:yes stop_codon:yes gene_type:complete